MNTFEGHSVLSKFVVCSPPSRSRRPRLRLCQRKHFPQKHSVEIHTKAHVYDLAFRWVYAHPAVAVRNRWVGDCSNEGDSSHWIVLSCERYWLSGVGGRGSARTALGGQDSPNKLFWNWNGAVRFASQEVWFDKWYAIWHFCNTVWYKLCRCDHSVLEFKKISPLMNW